MLFLLKDMLIRLEECWRANTGCSRPDDFSSFRRKPRSQQVTECRRDRRETNEHIVEDSRYSLTWTAAIK
jgi:hypothetical protein